MTTKEQYDKMHAINRLMKLRGLILAKNYEEALWEIDQQLNDLGIGD